MISCKVAETLISLRLDGELSRRLESDLDLHLETCSSCRDLLSRQRRVSRQLREALRLEDSQLTAIEQRFLRATASRGADRGRRAGLPAVLLLPAAAAAGLVLGIALWFAVAAPASSPTSSATFILHAGEEEQAVGVDGDPTLRAEVKRDRFLIGSGTPGEPGETRRGPVLELEKRETRFYRAVPVSNWY